MVRTSPVLVPTWIELVSSRRNAPTTRLPSPTPAVWPWWRETERGNVETHAHGTRPSTASDHPQSPSGRQAEHFGGTSAPLGIHRQRLAVADCFLSSRRFELVLCGCKPGSNWFHLGATWQRCTLTPAAFLPPLRLCGLGGGRQRGVTWRRTRTAPRPSTASDHPQSPSGRQAEHIGRTSAPLGIHRQRLAVADCFLSSRRFELVLCGCKPGSNWFRLGATWQRCTLTPAAFLPPLRLCGLGGGRQRGGTWRRMRTAPRPSTASDHPQSPSGRQAEHFGGTSAPSRFTASAQPLSTAKRLPHRNPRSQFSKHPAATMFEDDGDSSDGEGLQHASPHDIIPANGFHGTTADILRSPLRTSSSSVEEFQVEPLRVVGSSAGNCLICQGFFQRLERHMLTHTDERPFECKECPGRFKQRGHLVRHIASKHTKCLLRCKYCGKHLTRKDKLKQHMLLTCRIIREY